MVANSYPRSQRAAGKDEILAFDMPSNKAERAEKVIIEGIGETKACVIENRKRDRDRSEHWTDYRDRKFCHRYKNTGHLTDECLRSCRKGK